MFAIGRSCIEWKSTSLNSHDPVLQEKFGGYNIFIMDMEGNQDARNEIKDAINQAFEENGITIPEDSELRLTVDPYDFQIHASGVDEGLAKQIGQRCRFIIL